MGIWFIVLANKLYAHMLNDFHILEYMKSVLKELQKFER